MASATAALGRTTALYQPRAQHSKDGCRHRGERRHRQFHVRRFTLSESLGAVGPVRRARQTTGAGVAAKRSADDAVASLPGASVGIDLSRLSKLT